jgi:hydrogenase maturation protein HypF
MNIERARIVIRGAVQGVGFRPFVHRLAEETGLRGWVLNSSQGVFVEVEGEHPHLDEFMLRLGRERPARAVIYSVETSLLEPKGYDSFEIRQSNDAGAKTTLILPDMATCSDCLREILDPSDRHHLYPFTNCTNCGPRFSIIEALPYDRANTSMRGFTMCPSCEAEYRDPRNRRFHAQPTACPECGPQLQLLDRDGIPLAHRHAALLDAANAIRRGEILALKGLGGFQLMVDAANEQAVRRLRRLKHREEKPFAVMAPNLESVREFCHVTETEMRLLESSAAPVVLLRGREGLAPAVAPGNPNFGVMLPCSPIHHLLLRELDFPVVATSGNHSNEPICIDNDEALIRLSGIADFFLVHDRPIVRQVDDSVVRVLLGGEQVMRRARGYAPLPVHVNRSLPKILAVGGHLKNAVAMSQGNEIFVSQHIGDLETPAAHDAFRRVCRDLPGLYDLTPEAVACDMHPEYLSTKFAARLHRRPIPVQHHFAHVLSCMAENELEPPVLGIAWDGTGLGTDGTIWGGEFLIADGTPFTRAAHFRTFQLPGGETAIREPRRCALGMLYEVFGDKSFGENFIPRERSLLHQALFRRINSPVTSSAGRIFDAVASLLGLRQRASFEGQAAMDLEFAVRTGVGEAYTCDLSGNEPIVIDWEPMLLEIRHDLQAKVATGVMAAKFHNALVEAAVAVAKRIDIESVALTGGCFQNRTLTECLVRRLRAEGFHPFWHQRVPTNDGGIALGQVMAAASIISPVTTSERTRTTTSPCV